MAMSNPPFIMLDEASGVPLYLQIYNALRRSIVSSEYPPGSPLPASRPLAKDLKVSRMTATNAYDLLVSEGYLETRVGAGIFVAELLPEEFLQSPRNRKFAVEPIEIPRDVQL